VIHPARLGLRFTAGWTTAERSRTWQKFLQKIKKDFSPSICQDTGSAHITPRVKKQTNILNLSLYSIILVYVRRTEGNDVSPKKISKKWSIKHKTKHPPSEGFQKDFASMFYELIL
jgi:hypothetical protein